MQPQRSYLLGLVGSGVAPSLTPKLHMAEGRAQGLDYVYRPIDLDARGLDAERLPEILDWAERLGFDALNITHPCKRSVIGLLDEIDPVAAALGSVNTVRFTDAGRIGSNTDTTGFEHAFQEGLAGAPAGDVVLLGAGGAGSAVADALMRLGVERLVVVDQDERRARELAAELSSRHARVVGTGSADDLPGLLAGSDGIVQCTPIGMHHHPGAPFDVAHLHDGLWVADIVYRPLETELLRAARSIGCRTMHGGLMAVGQAADTFRLVTGLEPDTIRMHEHFQRLVDEEEALTTRRDEPCPMPSPAARRR